MSGGFHGDDGDIRDQQAGAGVAAPPDARAVPGAAQARDGACVVEPARQGIRERLLSLRGLRPAAFRLGHEVRQRHGLAELLGPPRGRGSDLDRPQALHGPHGSALPPVRGAPGSCLRRRSQADGPAVLHERCGLEVPPRLSGHDPRLDMTPRAVETEPFNNVARYEALMDVARNRMTNRAFAAYEVPRAHFELILEAARHAPSGANAQPWHYIVVTEPGVKQTIGQCFVDEQQHRARLHMGFPTPNYHGVKTAPGLIVIAADSPLITAFRSPNDGSDLERREKQSAERILQQSKAASTLSGRLAAA